MTEVEQLEREVAKRTNHVNHSPEITGEDLLNKQVEEIDCLVKLVIPRVGIGAMVGPSDAGKSANLRQGAMSIVYGSHWNGFPTNAKHHSVIYCSTEDDEQAMSWLIRKQNKGLGHDPAFMQGLRFIFDTSDLLNSLDHKLTDNPADMVIVDAFTDLYGKSMNDTNQVRNYLQDFSQLAQRHQCFVMFLHHLGKRKEDESPSKHNILGSQGFESKMRVVFDLRADLSNPELRHLSIVKGNYLPRDYKRESFVLRFDENMLFHNTGERLPIELLAKPTEDAGKKRYEEAKELRDSGLTYEQIAEKMGLKSKGSITKLFQRYDNVS